MSLRSKLEPLGGIMYLAIGAALAVVFFLYAGKWAIAFFWSGLFREGRRNMGSLRFFSELCFDTNRLAIQGNSRQTQMGTFCDGIGPSCCLALWFTTAFPLAYYRGMHPWTYCRKCYVLCC